MSSSDDDADKAGSADLAQPPGEVLQASDRFTHERGLNVLGRPLQPCSLDPVTGFFRDGCCRTCDEDVGVHTVCAVMTEEFLSFSALQGNDLSTPRPEYGFPGLKPGDQWCVCAGRWQEALEANMAPLVELERTHERTLTICSMDDLLNHAAGQTSH